MRIAALLLAAAGCYSPSPAVGVPCSADQTCPSGQFCDLARQPPLCVKASLDAAIDGAISCGTPTSSCPSDAPVCDSASMTCRRCAADDECKSGVCHENAGTCIDSDAVLYVDGATGRDDVSCSLAQPCGTIGRAISLADDARSFVRIAAGDYAESVAIGRSVVLSGTSRMTAAKLRTLFGSVIVVNGAGTVVTVETLQLAGSSGAGIDANTGTTLKLFGMLLDGLQSGITARGARVEVRQSTFSANNRAIEALDNSVLVVNRSTLRGNRDQVIRVSSSSYTITNSLFVDNERAITLEKQGIIALFDHNTVVGTTNDFAIRCNTAGTPVTNSILANNRTPSIDDNRCVVRYTLASDFLPSGTGNLTGDPGFVGPGDFHLGAQSKAVDTADPQSTEPTDFDGLQRPRGPLRDMGAFER